MGLRLCVPYFFSSRGHAHEFDLSGHVLPRVATAEAFTNLWRAFTERKCMIPAVTDESVDEFLDLVKRNRGDYLPPPATPGLFSKLI